MSRVKPRHSVPRPLRRILPIVFIASYALVMGMVGTRLTFFAEDYDLFLNQFDSGWTVVGLGSNGHWFPLTRAVLIAESALFGNWYGGYIAVNAGLLSTGLVLLARVIAGQDKRVQVLAFVAIVQISFVPQVLSVILLATNLTWALSFALAGLGAWCASRQRFLSATLVLVASSLSMSGLGILWTFLAIGFSFSARPMSEGLKPSRPWLGFALSSVAASVAVFGIGRVVAVRWDSPYITRYFREGVRDSGLLENLGVESVLLSTLLFGAWVLASSWPAVLALDPDFVPRVTFLLIGFGTPFAVLVTGVGLALIGISMCRTVTRKFLLPGLFLSFPALLTAGTVTVMRPSELFSERYALVWLPSLVGALFVLIRRSGALTFSRQSTRLGWLASGVILMSASVLLVLFPRSTMTAANFENPRWEYSSIQQDRSSECVLLSKPSAIEAISPYPTNLLLCELTLKMRDHAFLGL